MSLGLYLCVWVRCLQVASQFNCLEMIGPRVRPEDGITCYASDPTQVHTANGSPLCTSRCSVHGFLLCFVCFYATESGYSIPLLVHELQVCLPLTLSRHTDNHALLADHSCCFPAPCLSVCLPAKPPACRFLLPVLLTGGWLTSATMFFARCIRRCWDAYRGRRARCAVRQGRCSGTTS